MPAPASLPGRESLASPEAFRAEVMQQCQPRLLPGAVRDWPLLTEGGEGVLAQLRRHDSGRTAEMFVGRAEIGQRYYYDDDLTQFNFARETVTLAQALDRMEATAGVEGADTLYLGSLPAENHFPAMVSQVRTPFVPPTVLPRFWIGHGSQVACHYDALDNVACVAMGRRRFTLYPPEAIADLYVGPIDFTMAGQPVGLAVDSQRGDPRYPRFEAIRDRALVFELEPGDALYVPKLWWHKVEALDSLNVLVNFWWDGFSPAADPPYAALLLSMIAIAERPAGERAAWKAYFDHYVFRPEGHPLAFLPEEKRGLLGSLAEGAYQRIRMAAMRMLRGQ
ncbi:cupin-like domain-containing protein [Aurantiacibacter xanthus]|uniref:Cupin-like domain-containing protein n=1 Tax=Aurantiacibacter xanthus TaxID=1784712 RepID=A0A3A1NZ98_9SPHN|nr:cupin-like domain-containing protein [Aurantiacibacter xanthus]RIV81087.1 cupin-like domain-containing protein [Aurantiacibacter xanthus]